MRRQRQRGNSIVEFTLVGIPMIFVLISIIEMARGMWTYQTLAYAVKEGTRFAIVKGAGYKGLSKSFVSVSQVAAVVQFAGLGLDSTTTKLALSPAPQCCTDATEGCSLQFLTQTAACGIEAWPSAAPADTPGLPIEIRAHMPFDSALSFFWPGTGPAQIFGRTWFAATSSETIQF